MFCMVNKVIYYYYRSILIIKLLHNFTRNVHVFEHIGTQSNGKYSVGRFVLKKLNLLFFLNLVVYV